MIMRFISLMFTFYQILVENATEKSYHNFHLFKSNKLIVPSNVLGIGDRAVKILDTVCAPMKLLLGRTRL